MDGFRDNKYGDQYKMSSEMRYLTFRPARKDEAGNLLVVFENRTYFIDNEFEACSVVGYNEDPDNMLEAERFGAYTAITSCDLDKEVISNIQAILEKNAEPEPFVKAEGEQAIL